MDPKTRALITAAKNGDRSAAESLVTENMPLVKSIARRFMGRGTDMEDLTQIGCIGLIKAVERFDPSFGTEFSTYAVPMIMGEIKRFLRDDGLVKVSRSIKELAIRAHAAANELRHGLGYEPTVTDIAGALGIEAAELALAMDAAAPAESLYKNLEPDGNITAVDRIAADEGHEERVVSSLTLRKAIESLPQRERQIINLRYYNGKTQSDVAKIVGLSQVQVSRIEKKLLLRLREMLA